MTGFDSSSIEEKWQRKWEEDDVFKPVGPDSGKKKFFLIFAYPGISGYLHVGHMRGFTYSDIITRYKRVTGHDVLFPVGFHASGIPAIALAKRIERNDPRTIKYMIKNGCPKEKIRELGDVNELIEFFSNVYIEDYWKRFGFGMDFSRCMSTVSPGYKKFISWQFRKLMEKDLLITKPHFAPYCPVCGPVAVDTSMTDISQGGNAEVQEFTALKFRLMDGTVLPAATLRPETVFGVTNMWLHPDVEYVKARVGQEIWVLSPEAFNKLEHQMVGRGAIEKAGTVKGSELIGQTCRTPVGVEILILPGEFVDPKVASGVVMSVPAHAPFDWIALKDVKKELKEGKNPFGLDVEKVMAIEPITLIQARKEHIEDPAGLICKEMGIENQHEDAKLEEATRAIYKEEFHSGVLMSNCQDYAGLRVSRIKDTLRVDFIDMGLADVFYEFSEPVVCRSGDDVVIRRIPDQWFIKYSDEEWTERTKDWTREMYITPEEYKRDLPAVLDWFGDRACIRKGSWLGTEFPFKKEWTIEPISDSTLYPAYYTISRYVNNGELRLDWMDDRFFDLVLTGKGNLSDLPDDRMDIVEKIRKDFLYWYPLDINLSGKEHKTVHFPVFLLNHVAILEKEHWPRGIYVHWWVTMTGGDKISKTKGGAEPIPEAIRKYGVDAMRLYYCHVGSSSMDVEWVEESVSHYRSRMKRIFDQIDELFNIKFDRETDMDAWLVSRMMQRILETTKFLDDGKFREASNVVYFTLPGDIRWYIKRGGSNQNVLKECMNSWTRMLQPFTPHLSEEIWEKMGETGYVSRAPWPEAKLDQIDPTALKREEYVIKLLDDLRNIQKMTGIDEPKRIILYTASDWKWEVMETLFEMVDSGDGRLDPGVVIKKLISDPALSGYRKLIPKMVGRLSRDVVKLGAEERDRYRAMRQELSILGSVVPFLSRELGCEVHVFSEEDDEKDDPMNKARGSGPLKPAIFME
ncbi:MAG: leucine--tRNA ligase [Candidatus Thermoplasmatota archaeon]|nr:leucine--tRNA ligase [Candidatus Thermoplasmatota archaeon]